MPYLSIFFLIFGFLKTFYYGIFELKEKQNKPGGIAILVLAILRTCLSCDCHFDSLYYLVKIFTPFIL